MPFLLISIFSLPSEHDTLLQDDLQTRLFPLILQCIISFIFQILTWHNTHYIKCRVFTILMFIIQWCKIMFYNHFYYFKNYYMYLCTHTSAYVCMCMTTSQLVRLENNILGSVLSLYVGLRNWIQFMKIDGKNFFSTVPPCLLSFTL